MAISTITNMELYNAEFHSNVSETVAQNIDVVNAGSGDTIRVRPNAHRGDFLKTSFWQYNDLISRRVDTNTSAATPVTWGQDEVVGVKVKRRALVEITRDALVNVETGLQEAAALFGRAVGAQKVKDMLNTGLLALEAATANVGSAVNLDITSETTKTASNLSLNRTLALFGDKAQQVRAFAMHSKPNFDVVGAMLTDKVTGLTDVLTIQGAIPALMGRLALVTDSAALVDTTTSSVAQYATLGLKQGALTLEESDPEIFVLDEVTGLQNITYRMQVEYSYTISLMGYKWVVGSGRNPDDAAIGTGSNWAQVATSDKDLAAVRLVTR
jgi:hypothetical protein